MNFKKKRLFLALQIAVLWVLVFSCTFIAVYAWFFKDEPFDLPLDPSEFGVTILFDGVEGSASLKYTARAPTMFTYVDDPNDPNYDSYRSDKRFNSCLSAAEVEIKNIKDVVITASVTFKTTGSETKDGSGALISRNSSADPEGDFAVRYAIICESKNVVEAETDDYGYTDYKSFIVAQIDEFLDPQDIAALDDQEKVEAMNEAALDGVTIDGGQSITFLLVFWIDYNGLLYEYPEANGGYKPKNSPLLHTTYELLVTVLAKQSANT